MEHRKARRDLITAVILLTFSIVYFTQTFNIRQTSLISISSATIPKVCALVLAIVSLILLIESGLYMLQSKKRDQREQNIIDEEEKRISREKGYVVVCSFMILFFGILLTEKIGFTYGMFVYLLGTLILMNRHTTRKWILVTISIIVPLSIFVLFTRAFYLRLPPGFLDIGGGIL